MSEEEWGVRGDTDPRIVQRVSLHSLVELADRLDAICVGIDAAPWTEDGYRMFLADGVAWGEIKYCADYPLHPSADNLTFICAARDLVPRAAAALRDAARILNAGTGGVTSPGETR